MLKDLINKLIKAVLTGDYVAGKIRHLLSLLGGILVGLQLANIDTSNEWVSATIKLLTSKEFLEGISLYVVGYGSSVANKIEHNK